MESVSPFPKDDVNDPFLRDQMSPVRDEGIEWVEIRDIVEHKITQKWDVDDILVSI